MLHRIIQEDAEFSALRSSWDSLLETHHRPLLPLSWEWFSSWWESFGDGAHFGRNLSLCIHVFEVADEVRAIVPMMKADTRLRGVPVRAMCSMANGHSPLWDAVIHGDLTPGELAEIGRTILKAPDVEAWFFRRIAADSRLFQWLRSSAGGLGRLGVRETVRTPVVYTRGSWDEYLDTRTRKYRRNVRKKVREFDGHTEATLEQLPLNSGSDPLFEEIVDVSRRSWKAQMQSDLGSNHAGRHFLRRLIDYLGPRGAASVWIVRVDGRAIAYELHLKAGGITYPIRGDIDEGWRELAPGSVLEYRALEAAFDDPEIDVYDTCAADYWYLQNLTDDAREIHDAEFYPRRLKPSALHVLEYSLIPPVRWLRDRLRRPSAAP
jgi:CelD/BcsL family acetyltransferase involved in cellulose biosynthesis